MNSARKEPPIISVVGFSGSGKTTLLEKLIGELTRRGLRVGTIKHHTRDFEMDKPGKDSWRHKQAGASITVISSPNKIGMVMDVDHDYCLQEFASFFSGMDIVLAEGYKKENRPKLEVYRPKAGEEPICKNDDNLTALVSEIQFDLGVPRFAPDDIKGLADFIISSFILAGESHNKTSKKSSG